MDTAKSNVDHLYVRRGDILESHAKDEAVLLDQPSGIYFSLNETGRRLWDAIKRPCSGGDLAKILCDEFEVETQQASHDAHAFLQMLKEADLVVRA